ncbi:MAG: hypothetical protein H3Z53_00175 [archaeon]|nr:hypothetical protein [archaeon]
MVEWRRRWVWPVWEFLGFLMFLSGFLSENVVMMVIGVVMAFAFTLAFLKSYVKSEHIVEKALEVVSGIVALGIVIYGYVITGGFILGVITLSIVAMVFVAFVVSYLLPRIHSKTKSYN